MLEVLSDAWNTFRLKSRYRRLAQQQLVELLERQTTSAANGDDNSRWVLLGGPGTLPAFDRDEIRERVRALVKRNPYARNILRLLEVYVTGPGLSATPAVKPGSEATPEELSQAARVWQDFLQVNARHFSFREFARRTWRDGECFLRYFPDDDGSLNVRFVDPETICSPAAQAGLQGILTDPDDVETVLAYHRIDGNGALAEEIPANEMLHTRLAVDSNEQRGMSWFAALVEPLATFERWLDVELQARKLQASIVLWRKVNGSPSQLAQSVDAASQFEGPDGARKERWRAGTILTTSHSTDLQFLSPQTNFGDAVPLGRLLLLAIAAGTGLPEFMVACDASNANFASTMVAEGPAVKLFESQQQFFADEWTRLWRAVLQHAVLQGELPDDLFDRIHPGWTFPQLVNRDRSRERQTDASLIAAGVLSRSEVARRDGVDPRTMQREISDERSTTHDQ